MFKVTVGNTKLGTIPSINVPAIITCRKDCTCTKVCYANKGTFKFPSVKECYENNLKAYLDDPKQAETDIIKQLPLYGMVRWHSAGDIVNEEYFQMMVNIAKIKKGVKFMAFTKKYEIVNAYLDKGNKLPSNLKIIFSEWYDDYGLQNPHKLPMAYVYNHKLDNEVPKKAILCSGECNNCGLCWLLKNNQAVYFNIH